MMSYAVATAGSSVSSSSIVPADLAAEAEPLADIGGVLAGEASGGLARAGGAREQLHPAAAGRAHDGERRRASRRRSPRSGARRHRGEGRKDIAFMFAPRRTSLNCPGPTGLTHRQPKGSDLRKLKPEPPFGRVSATVKRPESI